MTAEQALQILTMATANINLTREQHSQIAQALQKLHELLVKNG